ncbi:MAG TPA: hypothetical protein VJR89_16750 [Polyangiales bacterium]|nr:hypothetical protein [Polyangiales bacterium]
MMQGGLNALHMDQNSHDAIRVRDPDVPYEGLPGQTRYECVHLVEPDGALRSVAVCRAINVQTHPELKARALTGLLHRFEDGRELALSFVYHDPEARRFALVLPSSLAHLELKEWSKLMSEIAEDTLHAVPAYVKEMTIVLGVAALARYIENEEAEPDGQLPSAGPARSAEALTRDVELSERENLLLQRERELQEQERALIRMAEGLTAREGELNRQKEALETARADVELREAELADQLGEQPEQQRAANWQEVGLAASGDGDATVVSDIPRRVAGETAYDAYGNRSLPPPLPVSRMRTGPPPLPLRPPRRTPPPLAPRRDAGEKPRRSTPPPLPTHDALVTEPHDPEPEVAAPVQFAGLHAGQMAYKLIDDELWLFTRLDEGHASAFRYGADLALQYVELEGYPIAVLTLLEAREDGYEIALGLDGRAEADLRVLEHLARSFRARVALYVESLYIETVTVSTLREGVAQAIHDKILKLPVEHGHDPGALLARVLEDPPPLTNDDLPFGPARREASTVVSVWASVEQLAAWLRPEKLNEATLTYSVPHHVIDATIRRVVRAAIAFGVGLPDPLLEQAVEHGAAVDAAAIVREQLHAFKQRVENGQNDLGAEATRKNWDRLLSAAEARGVEVDADTLAVARAEPSAERSELHRSRLFESASAAELKQKLAEPGARLEAIRELCVRGHASAIELVAQVLDSLRPNEAAVATAQLLTFGESACDGLITALGSPNDAVRQCAALALGRLQLRRALLPMLKQLEHEEQPLWTEIARAFGDFGSPALRSVVRVIPAATRPDRLVLALAHLANHGCAREVEKLENDAEPSVAQAARKAMARRARMEWEDLSVREQRTLTDASPAARLSQAFYAEASKVAI